MIYLKKVLNKQCVKVYYIEFPIRIRGLPNEIRSFSHATRDSTQKTGDAGYKPQDM